MGYSVQGFRTPKQISTSARKSRAGCATAEHSQRKVQAGSSV